MKQLRKHIKEEISRLMAEEKYPAPQEITDTLKMVPVDLKKENNNF